MKKIIAVLLVLMLSVSILAGCGGGVSGKYTIVQIEEDGEVTIWADHIKEMEEMYKEYEGMEGFEDYVFKASDYEMVLEFLSGGKCKWTQGEDSEDLTFEVKGKDITLKDTEGEELKGTIDGKKIVLDMYGSKMTFEKK